MLQPDISTENTFVNHDDKVVIYDELGNDLILGILEYSGVPAENIRKFKEQFRVVEKSRTFGDSNDPFDHGLIFIRLIERISDGKLFGFTYSESFSGGDSFTYEPNGDEHGYDYAWDDDYYPSVYVFLPVKQFTIIGYELDRGE